MFTEAASSSTEQIKSSRGFARRDRLFPFLKQRKSQRVGGGGGLETLVVKLHVVKWTLEKDPVHQSAHVLLTVMCPRPSHIFDSDESIRSDAYRRFASYRKYLAS